MPSSMPRGAYAGDRVVHGFQGAIGAKLDRKP